MVFALTRWILTQNLTVKGNNCTRITLYSLAIVHILLYIIFTDDQKSEYSTQRHRTIKVGALAALSSGLDPLWSNSVAMFLSIVTFCLLYRLIFKVLTSFVWFCFYAPAVDTKILLPTQFWTIEKGNSPAVPENKLKTVIETTNYINIY